MKLLIDIPEEIYQEAIKSGYSYMYDEVVANAVAEGTPLDDVRENVHGEWIREDIHSSWKCSRCNTYAIEDFEHCEIRSPFCPNCGADME